MTAVKNSAGTALAAYTYNARSRRTALDYANGASIAYEYDAASRLLEIDNQTNSGYHRYGYTYDKVGSRMTMVVSDGSGAKTHVYSYDKKWVPVPNGDVCDWAKSTSVHRVVCNYRVREKARFYRNA